LYGGCAVFWRADLNAQIHFVPPCNRRMCSVRVCGESLKLFFNMYMPYESNVEAADEFSFVLADVVVIIDEFRISVSFLVVI
jgi:hypothetical protein